MKKTLSLFLTACLLLVLLPATLGTAETAAEATPIRLFRTTSRPTNELTDLTRQYMIETLGVDVELIMGSTDWKQQLALFITSGDIPDIMAFMDMNTFLSYAEEGVFLDITDKVDSYPNIRRYISTAGDYDALLARTSLDGQVLGLPSVTIARSYYVTNIRVDWLNKFGLAIPTTLEEYTQAMRKFALEDPDGNGVQDSYGFSGYGYNYLTPFFGAFGATPLQDYFVRDGAVVTNVISDEYKQALTYLRDIYAEGLIDPELFTSDYNQAQEKWVRGQMGIWTSWWSGAGNAVTRFGFLEANPDAQVNVIQPPVGENGLSGVIGQDPVESTFAIAYNTKAADACMKLIDFATSEYGHQVLLYGIEGQFFELDDSDKITWYYGLEGQDRLGNAVSDMQCYRFFFDIEIENRARGLDDSPGQLLYRQSIEVYSSCPTYPSDFMGLTSPEFVTYNSELDSYKNEMGIKFILGEASLDADWDRYVSTFLSMGGEEVRQSLLEQYNAIHGTDLGFVK